MTTNIAVLTKTTRNGQQIDFVKKDNRLLINVDGELVYDLWQPLTWRNLSADVCDQVGVPRGSGVYVSTFGGADRPQIVVTPAEIEQIKAAFRDPVKALRAERRHLVAVVHSYDLSDAGEEMPDGPDTGAWFAERARILDALETARQAARDFDAAHPEIAAEVKAEREERLARFRATD